MNPMAWVGRMGWTRGTSPCTLTLGGCGRKDASVGTAWHSMAWHGTARHRTPPGWQAPAGSAGREVPTELCFSSQLKEKERNKEGNETPARSDAELCQAEVGVLSISRPHPAPGLELYPTPQ